MRGTDLNVIEGLSWLRIGLAEGDEVAWTWLSGYRRLGPPGCTVCNLKIHLPYVVEFAPADIFIRCSRRVVCAVLSGSCAPC
ncbi:hypothetical protein Scel_78690 [Streptomyces cellostaticus]|nr:hypothetical protein Scel_78690 [Streptomyces cellostaticus]